MADNKEFKGLSREESIEYQLNLWVKGISLHNPITDECCPDFSCCNGGAIMPVEMRLKYKKAVEDNDQDTQMMILGIALKGLSDKLYIIGQED